MQKLVRVCNGSDAWSLISLSNNCGKNVELKFVDRMRRQFEFSVDSFQINLDSMLAFFEVSPMEMSLDFYPTVVGESMFTMSLNRCNQAQSVVETSPGGLG